MTGNSICGTADVTYKRVDIYLTPTGLTGQCLFAWARTKREARVRASQFAKQRGCDPADIFVRWNGRKLSHDRG